MKKSGRAPCTRMSFTQWLTRSAPTVSWRPERKATLSLVPTPSALETSTGASSPPGTAYMPPNEPMPERVWRSWVLATSDLMALFARSAASRSTPAAR